MAKLEGVTFSPGYITVAGPSGPPQKFSIARVLRAADIPVGLTHTQVDGLRLLANLTVIVLRTLIARDLLDEDFADDLGMDWDLEHIIYALEQLGGSYEEPNLDNVEVA